MMQNAPGLSATSEQPPAFTNALAPRPLIVRPVIRVSVEELLVPTTDFVGLVEPADCASKVRLVGLTLIPAFGFAGVNGTSSRFQDSVACAVEQVNRSS